MKSIVRHIEYLLTRHDCVIVPGLGAFMILYHPARYDDNAGEYLSPFVSLGFNPQIVHNDWMLADSVARREQCPRETALGSIADEVRSMLSQLDRDGELSLGRLGRLVRSGGETPLFVPAVGGCASRYAGLSPIKVSPIEEKTEESAADEPKKPVRRQVFASPLVRIAACLAILLVWATVFINRSDEQTAPSTSYASLDSGLRAYDIIDALFAGETVAAPRLYIALPREKATVKPAFKPVYTASSADTPPRLNGDDPYMVIVASFATPAQAEKFMAENSSARLGVYPADGNYRIYAATATTLSGAVTASQSGALRARFVQAWVLRK